MKNLTASDRKSLIRLASSLPKGSPERKAILAGLEKKAASYAIYQYPIEIEDTYDLRNLKKFSYALDLGRSLLLLERSMSVDDAMAFLNKEEHGFGEDEWKAEMMDAYGIDRWEDLEVERL